MATTISVKSSVAADEKKIDEKFPTIANTESVNATRRPAEAALEHGRDAIIAPRPQGSKEGKRQTQNTAAEEPNIPTASWALLQQPLIECEWLSRTDLDVSDARVTMIDHHVDVRRIFQGNDRRRDF